MTPEASAILNEMRRCGAFLRGFPSLQERYAIFTVEVPLVLHGGSPLPAHREEMGIEEYRRLLDTGHVFLTQAVRARLVLPAHPRVSIPAARLLRTGLRLSSLDLTDEDIRDRPITQAAISFARVAEGVNARVLGRALQTYVMLQPGLVG